MLSTPGEEQSLSAVEPLRKELEGSDTRGHMANSTQGHGWLIQNFWDNSGNSEATEWNVQTGASLPREGALGKRALYLSLT